MKIAPKHRKLQFQLKVETNNGGDAAARSNFYIEDLISGRHMIEAMVAQMGESRLHDFEAKAKALRIEEIKLRAREKKFIGELLSVRCCRNSHPLQYGSKVAAILISTIHLLKCSNLKRS